MNWLVDAFWARIGWSLGELAITASIVVALCLGLLVLNLPKAIRRSRCKHIRYHETGACDAICNDCGKNLGFIGSIRDPSS